MCVWEKGKKEKKERRKKAGGTDKESQRARVRARGGKTDRLSERRRRSEAKRETGRVCGRLGESGRRIPEWCRGRWHPGQVLAWSGGRCNHCNQCCSTSTLREISRWLQRRYGAGTAAGQRAPPPSRGSGAVAQRWQGPLTDTQCRWLAHRGLSNLFLSPYSRCAAVARGSHYPASVRISLDSMHRVYPFANAHPDF